MEDMADKFLIIEEQNRIANEIHDNVSQRLFSIICSIAALTGSRLRDDIPGNVLKQLELIRETSNSAMHELRESIYRLSSRKNGKPGFISSIKAYLGNFSELNNIELEMNISGDEDNLTGLKRNYLYRIIREAAGNAVRHGGCSKLSVTLKMAPSHVLLSISDNGGGFDIRSINNRQERGLGLYNIKNMTEIMGGELNIDSNPGSGTVITVLINQNADYSEEGDMISEYSYS